MKGCSAVIDLIDQSSGHSSRWPFRYYPVHNGCNTSSDCFHTSAGHRKDQIEPVAGTATEPTVAKVVIDLFDQSV